MKAILVFFALALFGLSALCRLVLGFGPAAPATLSVATRRAGPVLAGRVLAAPCRVLRVPVGGWLARLYVSEGQPVKAGDLLLKLTRESHRPAGAAGRPMRPVFALAPVAGLRGAVGRYLAAGTPYAHLTPRGAGAGGCRRCRPVAPRRFGARADRPHRSGRGRHAPHRAAARPANRRHCHYRAGAGPPGWPPGTAVAVELVPLHPRGAVLVAN